MCTSSLALFQHTVEKILWPNETALSLNLQTMRDKELWANMHASEMVSPCAALAVLVAEPVPHLEAHYC